MKILVAHGSERGGTAGIAARIVEALRRAGITAEARPAREVREVRAFDAVIVGGALYAMRWHADARRFVLRHAVALRDMPVWFFSSGPLDDSADRADIPPTRFVKQLMGFVGAAGHATFGGRLEPGARGFIASSMAQQRAGDFRNEARIDAWTLAVARRIGLDLACPERRTIVPLPSRALPLGLCLLAGVPALFGGASLVARPDGSLIQLPLAVLAHSPFHDFLIPGLLLLLVVGVGNAWAAYLHYTRDEFAGVWSFASGGALVVWMAVEMIMLRSMHGIQIGYLLIGAAIVAESIREVRRLLSPVGGAPPARSPG